MNPPADNGKKSTSFVSDPGNPVPYRQRQDLELRFTPRAYMSDDQRFATSSARCVELSNRAARAANDTHWRHAGSLESFRQPASSADWVVKLIDVYPDDHPFVPGSDREV